MPNRISSRLENFKVGEKLLVPFFTAGFPSIESSADYVQAAEQAGADFVEIGVPFSDPLADGPDIQFSSYAALQNGISVKMILHMVEQLRKKTNIPLILMGYFNPILAYDQKKFIADASSCGVDGLIIPDLPVEEADEFIADARKSSISTIFLVSPTSSEDRIKLVASACSDFVYAVTVTGVTGTGKTFDSGTDRYLKRLRMRLNKPFVAGFGVSSPETAVRLARNSDGVVIGSALVKLIRASASPAQSIAQVEQFLSAIRKAL